MTVQPERDDLTIPPEPGMAEAAAPRDLAEAGETPRPLLGDDELAAYRSHWEAVQVRFVDDPRGTVQEADALVTDLMGRLAQSFADERAALESQWERGTDASTEDLRVAMQRYRSFFARLLAA
jgi:hypothetical protein